MAKRVARAMGILSAIVVLALAGLAAYVARTWDRTYEAPLPQVLISTDPAVLARGEYLVYGPAHCVECHGGSLAALQQLSDRVNNILERSGPGLELAHKLMLAKCGGVSRIQDRAQANYILAGIPVVE